MARGAGLGLAMELKPVYLLAPEPEPRRVSRRALLVFAPFAALFGFGIGAWVGSRRPGGSVPGRASSAEIEWALGLQRGDAAELRAHAIDFLAIVARHPASIAEFEPGLRQLAATEGDAATVRRLQIAVRDVLEIARPHLTDGLQALAERLRSQPR
ncbi:MAG: hypothetical protein IT457_15360 [Planctomycetes bacterium]|nr:hypothetical protein [Planctomycetota bacterium]